MPPSRFNRTSWPEDGAHRDLLEFLDAVHRRHGCRSLREIGRTMHLSYTRVHDIVRGASLPVDEAQVRDLVGALTGVADAETESVAVDASQLFVKARRARDEAEIRIPVPDRRPAGTDPAEPVVPEPRAAAEVAVPDGDVAPVRWDPPRSRRRVRRAVGAVVVLAAGVVGWSTLGPSGPVDAPPEQAGASPIVLQDSFDTDELDPAKWMTPTRADLIRPDGGVLNLVATPADTTTGVNARLEPRGVDTFREISFVVGAPEIRRSGPGGGGLTLREADGRTHRVIFGAGGDVNVVAALVCSRKECHQYDEYDPPGRYEHFATGRQVPVRVVQSDGQLQFYADDKLFAQGPRGDAPLTGFSIDLDGFKGEDWRLTVDSVRVTR